MFKSPGFRSGTLDGTGIFRDFWKVPKTGYFVTGIWLSRGIQDRDGIPHMTDWHQSESYLPSEFQWYIFENTFNSCPNARILSLFCWRSAFTNHQIVVNQRNFFWVLMMKYFIMTLRYFHSKSKKESVVLRMNFLCNK